VGRRVTNTTPRVVANFVEDAGSECPGFTVQVDYDGKPPDTLGAAAKT
jgi:hypothetical protein